MKRRENAIIKNGAAINISVFPFSVPNAAITNPGTHRQPPAIIVIRNIISVFMCPLLPLAWRLVARQITVDLQVINRGVPKLLETEREKLSRTPDFVTSIPLVETIREPYLRRCRRERSLARPHGAWFSNRSVTARCAVNALKLTKERT